MSTCSLIATRVPAGFLAIYCHSDGYPEGVGAVLAAHYTDPAKVSRLMALGDLSQLGAEIGEAHAFEDRTADQCTAYGRDRGEADTAAAVCATYDDLIETADQCGAEWLYVFDGAAWGAVDTCAIFRARDAAAAAIDQAKKPTPPTVAELIAKHPHLVSVSSEKGRDSLNCAAKNLRIELRRLFPAVTFSVRSSRFSGGDSLDVSWVDGPNVDQVKPIVERFEGGSFDGMTDSYTYSHSAFNAAFGDAKYCYCHRKDSDAAVEAAIRTVRAKYAGNLAARNINAITVADFRAGRYWRTLVMDGGHWQSTALQSLINVELARRTWALPTRQTTEHPQPATVGR